jgi:hypothetical protein
MRIGEFESVCESDWEVSAQLIEDSHLQIQIQASGL